MMIMMMMIMIIIMIIIIIIATSLVFAQTFLEYPFNARCLLRGHTYLNKPTAFNCKFKNVWPFTGHQLLKTYTSSHSHIPMTYRCLTSKAFSKSSTITLKNISNNIPKSTFLFKVDN